MGLSYNLPDPAGVRPNHGVAGFAGEGLRPKLALSLNASNDGVREQVMPITRKYHLKDLMEACKEYPLRPWEHLTFEYVLLRNTNDSPQHARELAELVRGMKAKINLIALNPGPGVAFQTPADEAVLNFQRILTQAGVPAFIRRPRGIGESY